MTGFTTLTDADLAQDKPITQAKARALRDNPLAIAEGDNTAPKIKYDALAAFEAGDYVLAQSLADSTTASTSYAKVKEVQIPRGGVVRVKFTLDNSATGGSNFSNAKVYVNGTAVSGNYSMNFGNDLDVSYDTTVSKGDLVQIYASVTGGVNAIVRNFKICGSEPWGFAVNI